MGKLGKYDVLIKIPLLQLQGLSQREIGERFGVSQTTISLILRGKTWANLYDEPVPDVSPETYRRILGYDPFESLRPEKIAARVLDDTTLPLIETDNVSP